MTTGDRTTMALRGTFLASLTGPERADLERLAVRRRFPTGAVLMFEHEPGERVMILVRGRVKISSIRDGGRELMYNIRDPGDVLGELSVVDDEPRVATISALDPVEALVISADTFWFAEAWLTFQITWLLGCTLSASSVTSPVGNSSLIVTVAAT